jgi:hypothetical protein
MESTRTGPQAAGKARQQPPQGQPDQGTDVAVVNPATLASWEKKGGVTAPTSRSEAKERQRQSAPPGRAKPAGLPAVAPELAAVQLVDGKTAAQVGDMSLSWWHEMVSKGIAPQPLFRAPRCTRWRAAQVAEFWRDWRPADAAVSVVDLAKQASAKAGEGRRAAAAAADRTKAQRVRAARSENANPESPSTPTTPGWAAIRARASGASQNTGG